jgi:DNA-directed RNA polymerase subunit H
MAANPVLNHRLVPAHSKLSKKESEEILEKYKVSAVQLPKILVTDSAIARLKCEVGDIILVERKSPTKGAAVYYRVVVSE